MKRRFIWGIIVFLLLCLFNGCGQKKVDSTSPAPQESSAPVSVYNDILAVSEVEEIAGIKGLEMKAEGSKLTFTGSDDAVVYEVRFFSKDFYEKEVGDNRELFTDVSGVGEKAAICIPDSPYRLVFVKGDRCVMTQTLANNADGDPVLSQEQLIDAAKMIASKLPD